MSLINDALKRAKAAQDQAPAGSPRGPEFKPVALEANGRAKGRNGLVLALFAVVAVLSAAVVWLWPKKAPENTTVQAVQPAVSTATVQSTPPTKTDESVPLDVTAPTPQLANTPIARPAGDDASAPRPVALVSEVASNSVPEASALSNSAVTVETAPPKPPPLKLQAILLNATHPSAMIGGKTLFIGDSFGDLQLIAIGHQSATLVGAGKTNVLSLP